MRFARIWAVPLVFGLAACDTGGFSASKDTVFAPSVDPRGETVSGLVVGHRLMSAGEYDLALDAFKRAAAEDGLTPDVMAALGSANLALGRLGQAEKLLRQVIKDDPQRPEGWNNLGVVLMESGQIGEAAQVFRQAFALDNGQSVAIRDNLRLALAKLENSSYGNDTEEEYKLVRRGSSDYLIRPAL